VTNEEFERHMDFMIEQQTQFDVRMQQLQEAHALHEQNMTELQAAHTRTEEVLAQVGAFVAESVQVVNGLARATFAGFTELNVKINALVDAQILTDDALRNLILKFDRHLSEGHNNN